MQNESTSPGPNVVERTSWQARALLGGTIPEKTLALFFDGLAALVAAGFSVPGALGRASSGTDPELHHICRSAALVVSRGVPLSAALRPYAHRLPELVLPVLEVGELSETLDAAARRLSDAFGRRAAAEHRFRYAVFDPWLVILALTLIKATRLVGDGPLGIIQGALTTLLTLAAYYLGGRLLVRALLRWPWLRLQVDTIKVALPHRSAVVRNLAAARWARSFATLWGAGVAISPALEVSSRSALNAYYEQAILRASGQTRLGRSLHQSLSATHLLPAHLLSVIATGETSGHLAEMLERLASGMEEEALARATQEMMVIVTAGEVVLGLLAAGGAL